MEKRIKMLFACLFLVVGMAMAQMKVSGTVLSEEDGQPVIGASIRVTGTGVGTVTDANGKFTITCPQGKKMLTISYVGMEPVEVSARANMRILLRNDQKNLDEIVVVAYGTTKKSSFTGSATTMKDKDMSAQKTSLVKSLEGKMAGVKIGASTGDPGSDQQVLIRGIGSINGSTQPLYVIDGVPVVNSDVSVSSLRSQSVLATMNPNDIESITVLKDAAASSLYGSRAANGVIIITTKKGNVGKTNVNYEMQMGWSEIAKKSAFDMMNSSELKQYYKDALQGYFEVYGGFSPEAAAEAAADEVKNGGWFYDYDNDATTDWYKEVYRKGFTTDHQVSINGGNEKTKFYASFGYNKVNGVVKGSSFDRYSGRLNIDHKVNDWFKVSAKQMLSFTNQKGFRDQSDQAQGFGTTAPMSILFSMDPTAPNKLEDGSYNPNASFS